jgi:hypothetical protein
VQSQGHTAYTLKPYAGMQHTATPAVIADALQFLQTILPPMAPEAVLLPLPEPANMSVKALKTELVAAGQSIAGLAEKQDLVDALVAYRRTQAGGAAAAAKEL